MEDHKTNEFPRSPEASDWAQDALVPKKPPFSANRREQLLAFGLYVLAYLYLGYQWWALPLFTAGFIAAAEYLFREQKRSWESWVWLGCMLLVTGCIAWRGLHPYQYDSRYPELVNHEYILSEKLLLFILHIFAVYWLMSRSGRLTGSESGHLLPLDALYAFVIIPFKNFFLRIRCVLFALKPKKERKINAGAVAAAVLAAFTLVYLEKFFRKICPPVISMIVVPFCSLVLSVIIAHTVLGPIGWKIGTFISDIVYAGISGSFRVVFGAIFGFVYAPLVITGLHHMSNAIDMQLIADFGGTMLWPMIALSNIAQGSAVLGMIYLQRKNAAEQEVNVPSCISCYLGVTEPAMFGVNLKFHFPFICGMIGSAIAAVVCVATSTTANAIGVGGIPGILSIQPAYMLSFALCMAIAIVVPFVLTVIVGKKKGVA